MDDSPSTFPIITELAFPNPSFTIPFHSIEIFYCSPVCRVSTLHYLGHRQLKLLQNFLFERKSKGCAAWDVYLRGRDTDADIDVVAYTFDFGDTNIVSDQGLLGTCWILVLGIGSG